MLNTKKYVPVFRVRTVPTQPLIIGLRFFHGRQVLRGLAYKKKQLRFNDTPHVVVTPKLSVSSSGNLTQSLCRHGQMVGYFRTLFELPEQLFVMARQPFLFLLFQTDFSGHFILLPTELPAGTKTQKHKNYIYCDLKILDHKENPKYFRSKRKTSNRII